MRQIITLCLGLVALAGAARAEPATVRGGEDWPFFCTLNQGADGGVDGLKLVSDSQSPNGYGLELYAGSDFVAYVIPDVNDSDDKKFLMIYGETPYGVFKARSRQILAAVAKDGGPNSWGDVQITWAGQQAQFYQNPMNCKANR
jgi:hypothetical protein